MRSIFCEKYEKYILPICEKSAIIGHCACVLPHKLFELTRCSDMQRHHVKANGGAGVLRPISVLAPVYLWLQKLMGFVRAHTVMAVAFATAVTIKPVKAGECFTKENLWVKRPGTGEILAEHYDSVLGKRALCDIENDTQLRWDMIENGGK